MVASYESAQRDEYVSPTLGLNGAGAPATLPIDNVMAYGF